MQYPDRTNKRRGGAENSLICSYLHPLSITSITAGFQDVPSGPDQKGKGPAGFSPDAKSKGGAKFQNKGGATGVKRGATTIKAGEGVCNQNGKAGVALKKISVQNPQNRSPYQNVLVSKKFSEKNSGK